MVNPLFTTEEMSSLFSAEATVGRMLAFEAALASAEAAAGVIPVDAAQAIAAACQVDLIDVAALYRDAAPTGTPVIPLVQRLTELVEADAGRFVHWGATSQDTIDTALVMQMGDALHVLRQDLLAIGRFCAGLAGEHRKTLMPGRTLLQHALPITFGLKAARWLALVTRQLSRIDEVRQRALVVQFGGAAGTLAALGDMGNRGIRVTELLAQALHLGVPELPWHTERDRIADVAAALGVIAGAMAKIATDLVLLSQTEVGEVSEAAGSGKGGSSAMPQKQNPVEATFAVAAARLAIALVPAVLGGMAQEHERGAGNWQAEWAAIPDLFCYTAGAVARVRAALDGLVVHVGQMGENVQRTKGLIMSEALTIALAGKLGRTAAFRLVREACQEATRTGVNLRRAAQQSESIRAALSDEEIDEALDPLQYLGSTEIFIQRALDGFSAT